MKDMTTDEHIKLIYERLENLTRAMLGDKEFGNRGYRQRIERAETKLESHDDRMDKIDKRFEKVYQRVIGITIGVSIAAGAVGWVIENSVIEAEANPVESVQRIEVPSVNEDLAPMVPPYNVYDLKDDTVSLDE